jgi:hypothetical protein
VGDQSSADNGYISLQFDGVQTEKHQSSQYGAATIQSGGARQV